MTIILTTTHLDLKIQDSAGPSLPEGLLGQKGGSKIHRGSEYRDDIGVMEQNRNYSCIIGYRMPAQPHHSSSRLRGLHLEVLQ